MSSRWLRPFRCANPDRLRTAYGGFGYHAYTYVYEATADGTSTCLNGRPKPCEAPRCYGTIRLLVNKSAITDVPEAGESGSSKATGEY